MLLLLLIIITCCVAFSAPVNVTLAMIGVVLWAGVGYDVKYGCLGRLFDLVLLVAGAILILLGCLLS